MTSLLATVLAGSADWQTLRDACDSATGIVDNVLLIDTTGGRGVELERLGIVRGFHWTGSAAEARNFALRAAEVLGFDWAMTLDADERLVVSNVSGLHAELDAQAHCSLLLAEHESRSYSKERFFSLKPIKGQWVGPVHEAFVSPLARGSVTGLRFSELEKTPEQQRAKDLRIIAVLERYTVEHPTEPRWHFYLAESYRNLDRKQDAVRAYDACYRLNGWAEESAWACYLAATLLIEMNDLDSAMQYCHRGLARHGGIAELAWLLGYLCHGKGRFREAMQWAQYAADRGAYAGDYFAQERIGFKDLPALWEGPYDVLRFAAKSLGQGNALAAAQHAFVEAKRWRLEK